MPVKTTLVVDDSKSARIMLSRMLKKTGLEVSMVESGKEAIRFMENNPPPDVIFMDHMMPGMDGVQTSKAISGAYASPIFMYTSKEGPEYEAEAKMAGAAGILGKPAEMERLHDIIAQLNNQPSESSDLPIVDEPVTAEEIQAVDQAIPNIPETESPEMSTEQMQSIAEQIASEQIQSALQPIQEALQDLKANLAEGQSEIRKLAQRQANSTNMVTQPVLDASIKQTTAQFQNQVTNEVKTLRDLIERSAELSSSDLEKIKELAIKSGALAGSEHGEKAATSAAEAVAAKVSAAQAQIQVQQDLAPLLGKLKAAQTMSIISVLIALGALATLFVL
ncbi:MAG: hypothetical protein C9356_03195 [Oleiphilus sp.]|nr:MAG: hypothetical protein C9356_03195 [Oleiphilus sp.]